MKSQSRRKFLADSAAIAASGVLLPAFAGKLKASPLFQEGGNPIVISTWNFGRQANAEAWKVIAEEGLALDAVESGIRIIEADPTNHSVGYGGYPDRDGHVTLDACIMDSNGRAGSVTFVEGIMHPISLARKVMEDTPHVMLSGEGALQFALEKGFKQTDLLTDDSRKAWQDWMKKSDYQPVINIENHDTIGLLCLDSRGDLSGGCSTSGLAYKMHGRVGDSPIIGAALFVDNEVGGAVTTGLGELVMRSLSSFLVVEFMRNGYSPQQACEAAIHRTILKNPEYKDNQVGILALDKSGQSGAYAIHPGFSFALRDALRNEIIAADSYLK